MKLHQIKTPVSIRTEIDEVWYVNVFYNTLITAEDSDTVDGRVNSQIDNSYIRAPSRVHADQIVDLLTKAVARAHALEIASMLKKTSG